MKELSQLIAFVATRDQARARAFYEGVLGLRLLDADSFALAFDVGGVMLRVTNVHEITVAPYTVLGWKVTDIEATVASLEAAGVQLERYPHFTQDAHGIWDAPGGSRIAWFKDPDGNTLSVAQIESAS